MSITKGKMTFLKTETINKIIILAEDCVQQKRGPRICRPIVKDIHKVLFDYLPKKKKLADFIDSLNDNEKIELLVLMKLGRGDLNNWEKSLDNAETNFPGLGNYIASKALRLPSYLREGLDKLSNK